MALLWTFGRQHPNERRNCPCLQDTLTYVGLENLYYNINYHVIVPLFPYAIFGPSTSPSFPLRRGARLPPSARSRRQVALASSSVRPNFHHRRDGPNVTGLKPRQRVVTVSRLHSQLADYRIPSSLMPHEPGGHGGDDDGLQPDDTR
jgi:hypothetical protein